MKKMIKDKTLGHKGVIGKERSGLEVTRYHKVLHINFYLIVILCPKTLEGRIY